MARRKTMLQLYRSLHHHRHHALLLFVAISAIRPAASLPFIVLHGLGESCESKDTTMFMGFLIKHTGEEGYCVEIGNGIWTSVFTSITKQADEACKTIKSMSELESGYNMVGISQGSLIGRGVIQWCEDAPPVNTLISIGGPHAGTASVPYCRTKILCKLGDFLIQSFIYTSFVQEHFGPAGYVKIPTDLEAYYNGCKFLPRLNNELKDSQNTAYKDHFSSLNQLVLIMFEKDNVLVPRETAWFGYYPDDNTDTVLAYNETDLYIEDWIGLRTLEEAGKVIWLAVPRGHLLIDETEILEYIVPYLVEPTADM